MARFSIAVLSQKGGVGKSTYARTIATEFQRNKWDTIIADLDFTQGTSTEWAKRRLENDVKPHVSVQIFRDIAESKRLTKQYHLIVYDGQPAASVESEKISKAVDMVVIPLGMGEDERVPAVQLARKLVNRGVPRKKILFVFFRVEDSDAASVARVYEEVAEEGFYTSKAFIKSRTLYRNALSQGRALTEVPHRGLRDEARAVLQDIVTRFHDLTSEQEQGVG